MTDNTATRKDVRRKEKEARQAEKDRGTVIIQLLESKAGRNYAWEILAEAHVFATSYSGDALAMAFAEGERNFGLRMLNDIMQWCPEQYIQMMREQNERRTDGRNTSDSSSGGGPESYPDDDDSGTDPGYDVYRDV